jgi:hypothetical protein
MTPVLTEVGLVTNCHLKPTAFNIHSTPLWTGFFFEADKQTDAHDMAVWGGINEKDRSAGRWIVSIPVSVMVVGIVILR